MGQLLAQVAIAALTAVITAPLTVWLSLRRFHAERWWERKLAAYISVIESLHHMKRNFDENIDAVETSREVPEQTKRELTEKYRAADSEILKNTDVGEFLFPPQAVAELRALAKNLDRARGTTDWYEHLDHSSAAISECLKKIILIAKVDLHSRTGL